MSVLEIAANALITVSILFAGRNSVHTWWTGIIGCALFGVLFYQARLYADVTLQIFFVGTSALGWYHWVRGSNGDTLSTSHASRRGLVWASATGLVALFGYGFILYHYSNAYAPFLDSAILVFSVIAQLLLMQRKIETWWFWLGVNTIAVPLYLSRGLYLTSALYTAYWVNAVISSQRWRRDIAGLAAEREALP